MDVNFLIRTLRVQSKSRDTGRMNQFILAEAKALGLEADIDNGNIYITKGKAKVYPTFVAHTDTVHTIRPRGQYRVIRSDDMLFAMNPETMRMTGVGGDDKVGIFLALSCLRKLPAVKVAFFRDEEIGCLGSAKAKMKFFKNAAFVLQADRRGVGDFVRVAAGAELYGENFSEVVQPLLEPFGFYEYSNGSITDVMTLKDNGLDVAAANVACGYYYPHSNEEVVSISDVENTLDLFLTIAEKMGNKKWEHTPSARTYGYYTRAELDAWEGWDRTKTQHTHSEVIKGAVTANSVVQADRDRLLTQPRRARIRVLGGPDEYESFNDYIERRNATIDKYVTIDRDQVRDIIGDDTPLSDDETDMDVRGGGTVNDFCPYCGNNTTLLWSQDERDYFCMVCQEYFNYFSDAGTDETSQEDVIDGQVRELKALAQRSEPITGVRVG